MAHDILTKLDNLTIKDLDEQSSASVLTLYYANLHKFDSKFITAFISFINVVASTNEGAIIELTQTTILQAANNINLLESIKDKLTKIIKISEKINFDKSAKSKVPQDQQAKLDDASKKITTIFLALIDNRINVFYKEKQELGQTQAIKPLSIWDTAVLKVSGLTDSVSHRVRRASEPADEGASVKPTSQIDTSEASTVVPPVNSSSRIASIFKLLPKNNPTEHSFVIADNAESTNETSPIESAVELEKSPGTVSAGSGVANFFSKLSETAADVAGKAEQLAAGWKARASSSSQGSLDAAAANNAQTPSFKESPEIAAVNNLPENTGGSKKKKKKPKSRTVEIADPKIVVKAAELPQESLAEASISSEEVSLKSPDESLEPRPTAYTVDENPTSLQVAATLSSSGDLANLSDQNLVELHANSISLDINSLEANVNQPTPSEDELKQKIASLKAEVEKVVASLVEEDEQRRIQETKLREQALHAELLIQNHAAGVITRFMRNAHRQIKQREAQVEAEAARKLLAEQEHQKMLAKLEQERQAEQRAAEEQRIQIAEKLAAETAQKQREAQQAKLTALENDKKVHPENARALQHIHMLMQSYEKALLTHMRSIIIKFNKNFIDAQAITIAQAEEQLTLQKALNPYENYTIQLENARDAYRLINQLRNIQLEAERNELTTSEQLATYRDNYFDNKATFFESLKNTKISPELFKAGEVILVFLLSPTENKKQIDQRLTELQVLTAIHLKQRMLDICDLIDLVVTRDNIYIIEQYAKISSHHQTELTFTDSVTAGRAAENVKTISPNLAAAFQKLAATKALDEVLRKKIVKVTEQSSDIDKAKICLKKALKYADFYMEMQKHKPLLEQHRDDFSQKFLRALTYIFTLGGAYLYSKLKDTMLFFGKTKGQAFVKQTEEVASENKNLLLRNAGI